MQQSRETSGKFYEIIARGGATWQLLSSHKWKLMARCETNRPAIAAKMRYQQSLICTDLYSTCTENRTVDCGEVNDERWNNRAALMRPIQKDFQHRTARTAEAQ